MSPHSRIFKWPLIAILILVALGIYYALDPANFNFFPKCPFYWLTGYKCPGCGSQRALHHLLHFDFPGAFRENPLLVMAIPYILGAFLFDYTSLSARYPKTRKVLYGFWAILIAFIIVITYWVVRNI
jgi:hypothetical protein